MGHRPVTPDGGVTEPAPGDATAKYDDHDRVQAAVLAADIEHLAHIPLADLATEHVALRAARPTPPTHDHPAARSRRLAEAARSARTEPDASSEPRSEPNGPTARCVARPRSKRT